MKDQGAGYHLPFRVYRRTNDFHVGVDKKLRQFSGSWRLLQRRNCQEKFLHLAGRLKCDRHPALLAYLGPSVRCLAGKKDGVTRSETEFIRAHPEEKIAFHNKAVFVL